jgi:hypothetical protein
MSLGYEVDEVAELLSFSPRRVHPVRISHRASATQRAVAARKIVDIIDYNATD